MTKTTSENKGVELTECAAYQNLKALVEEDERRYSGHDYQGKLAWIVERAQQYETLTGIPAAEILAAWESRRNYWYMNYYQESNQPAPDGGRVRVVESQDEFWDLVGEAGFRCPHCKGVSRSAYECDSGLPMGKKGEACDWKAWGLLGTLGKGVYVFIKERKTGTTIFMPVAWEKENGDG